MSMELQMEITTAINATNDIDITDVNSVKLAEANRKKLVELKKKIKAVFAEITDPLKLAKKNADAMMKSFSERVEACETNLLLKLKAYQRAEEEKAEKERQRLVKIAREEAEAARLKAIEEAENAKKLLEKAGATEDEVKEKAKVINNLYETPLEVTPVKVKAPAVKLDQRTFSKKYYAEVTDESIIPREYLIPDITKLNKKAREEKEAFNVPGVKVSYK